MADQIDWSKVQLSLRPANDGEQRTALEFQKLWGRTRAAGEELGWNVSPGSRVELYFLGNDDSLASEIFVSPYKRDRFLFRATPKIGMLKEVRGALTPIASNLPGAEVVTNRVTRSGSVKIDVVEVRSTWDDVVGDDHPANAIVAARLHEFVTPLVRALRT